MHCGGPPICQTRARIERPCGLESAFRFGARDLSRRNVRNFLATKGVGHARPFWIPADQSPRTGLWLTAAGPYRSSMPTYARSAGTVTFGFGAVLSTS